MRFSWWGGPQTQTLKQDQNVDHDDKVHLSAKTIGKALDRNFEVSWVTIKARKP